MNPWLCITIVPMVCYCARIFTRPFTVQFNPAGERRSFSALVFLLPFRAERKVQNERGSEKMC